MKKRILSTFLALAMCLSLLPTAAFAEGTEGGSTAKPSDTDSNGYYEIGTPEDDVAAVQALIDALPTLDTVTAADYDAVQSAYDAYDALTEEQQESITGVEIFEPLFAWFNEQTETVDETPTAGWNADTNTYYVVGTAGYPLYAGSKITLADGATLDLTYADDYVKGNSAYSKICLFFPEGDLTIKGDGKPISFDGRCIVYDPGKSYILTLDNLNWVENSAVYNTLARNTISSATIQYKGACRLPQFSSAFKAATTSFQPKADNASLSLCNLTATDGKVIFDGGEVNVSKLISAESIEIKNSCTLTVSGDDAEGIRLAGKVDTTSDFPSGLGWLNSAAGKLSIQNSTVNITIGENAGTGSGGYALGSASDPQFVDRWYYSKSIGLITSSVEIDHSSVTVDVSANESISGIGGVKDIKITNNSVVTATVSNDLTGYNKYYLSAIGGMFENISIENSTVTANGGYAAGIGTGHSGFSKNTTYYGEAGTVPGGTITIADSTVTAASINGAAIGTSPVWNTDSYKPQNVNVTISGNSHVVARSVNGAGIGGGMLTQVVKDPDAVIINPGIGGWDNGNGGSIGTQSLLRTASVVGDSNTPTDVSKNVSTAGQTLTVKTTNSETPTILAESGVCAISSETVTTDTPIIQNTVKTAATQTTPIKVGDTLLADLHKGYKSVARTANAGTVTDGTSVSFDAISTGTYGMTYGGGSDPAPLISWSGEPVNGSTFRIVANQINRFWTMPQTKLDGSVTVATGSATGTQVTEAVKDTMLYANISSLTPTEAKDSVTYQWYKNGTAIGNATGNSYTPTEVGQYSCVVTGTGLYYGDVTSNLVAVKNSENDTVPGAPELDTRDKTSITLKSPTDGQTYEYSIDNGQSWQDGLTFSGLQSGTTYNIIRRVKTADNSGTPSTALTVKTANDVPDAASILTLIDYENEKLSSLPADVNFYSDEECTQKITSLTSNNSLTAYIAAYGESQKYIYARYNNVTETGDGNVTAVAIPARPATPTLNEADVSVGVNAITVNGVSGVSYTCNGTTATCDSTPLTFGNLTAETNYTITAQLPASNTGKNFRSAQASLSVTTLATGTLATTILIPSGSTTAMTYDLTEVINAVVGAYTFPTTLTSSDSSISATVSGNSVTVSTTSSTAGTTATLTGTGTTITVKIVNTVGQSENGKVLWLWEQTNLSNTETKKFTDVAGADDTELVSGTVYRLTPVYAYGEKAESRVTDTLSSTVTLPYWSNTTSETPYVLVYQNPTTLGIAKVSGFTQAQSGITLTRTQEQHGLYGLYAVKLPSRTVTFNANGGTVDSSSATTGDNGKLSALPTPTRSGYTFDGWYTAAEGGDKVSTDTVYTESTTLYAHWTHVDHTGGTATCLAKAICETCSQPYGDFGSHDYTVENKNAAGALKTAGDCQNESVYYKSCSVCGGVSTRDEDTFAGEKDPDNHTGTLGDWQKDGNGHWKVYSCCPNVRSDEGEHSFVDGVCRCGAVQYIVTFDPNGGTVSAATAATDISGRLSTLPTPTRGGYSFDGWYTAAEGGDKVSTDTVYTESTTLYARWTQNSSGSSSSHHSTTYTITVKDSEDGDVTVSPKNASKGTTVTVTVTPDAGYTLETLSVTDKNGNKLTLTDNGDGTYSFKMPAGKITVNAVFALEKRVTDYFVDVPADSYYADAVLWAVQKGVTGGVDETHFGPNLNCTRAQLVTFLWRAAGCPVVDHALNFTDVGDGYYTEAVRWAASLGIVGGYGNGQFGTGDTITREQFVTILYRFAKATGMDISVGEDTNILSYGDASEVSEYAVEAMQWAVGAGIVQGNNGNLMPNNDCTRAQIVTMLYRLLGQ